MADQQTYYVSIDTGGTFTDGYVSHPEGSTTVKVPTTDHDLTVCFRNCIDKAAAALDLSTQELLVDTEIIRFSTTIGTNTIIERSGPKIGLIVSEGEESKLLDAEAAESGMSTIIDQELVEGISGRTTADGIVEEPVEDQEVLQAAKTLMNRGAKLLVVSLTNSFYNPENEERVRTIIETEYPPHYLGPNRVLTANEVSSRPEYDARTYTALINAYIHRPMARSLYKAEDEVRDEGYSHPLLIGQSTGGVAGVSKTVALRTYNSGPVAGILGAEAFRELYGLESVLSTDMGGTSVDIGTILEGSVSRTLTPEIMGHPVHVPMIEVHTAGAGGGSIASVQDDEIQVGPESAGAEPGPACYDLGGIDPTVTDADVVLGYIDPNYFLGGDQQLNADRAENAIERDIADALDITVAEAAMHIRQQVDQNISASITEQLVSDGVDPAETTLISYGGAGPTHCCSFAEKAGISQIITAPAAAEFSAFGGATLDVEHEYTASYGKTVTRSGEEIDPSEYNETVEALRAEAINDMRGEGFDPTDILLDLRLLVKIDGETREIDAPLELDAPEDLQQAFSVLPDNAETIAINTFTLRAVGPVPTEDFEEHTLRDADPSGALRTTREAYWPDTGWQEVEVYRREHLEPGNIVQGRSLIEAKDTTYVIPDGWRYEIDEYGNGLIQR